MYREWKEIEFPKKYLLYMNLETTRLRGRPRCRWKGEVREDGRIKVEKGGRKGFITGRKLRSYSEWQGTVAFCKC
jgi:hypothetical protein